MLLITICMTEKYNLEDKIHKSTDIFGRVLALGGAVATIYGLVTQDQETAIAGGALFSGGVLTYAAESMNAYFKTKIQYMNDREKRE